METHHDQAPRFCDCPPPRRVPHGQFGRLRSGLRCRIPEHARGVQRVLADAAATEALIGRADALYDRIRQHRRDNHAALSDEELDRLLELSREVRSFETLTRVVGQNSNGARASIEAFDTVGVKLGLEPQVLQTHESGLELVRIDVGSFVSLLIRNPTATTFTVMYEVNDPERPGGVGAAACESYAVMSGLFNSRDRDIEGLEFTIQARATPAAACD